MAEPTTTSTPDPAASTTPAPASTDELDLSKLSGEQLNKVLENKELYKTPRIAELLQAQKDLKKFQADQEKEKEKSLEEQKKFQELADERGIKITTLEKQLQDKAVDQDLINLLVKENTVDLEGALKLIDRSKISVDDNGQITGVEEALTSLKTDKAYLFNNSGVTVGTPSNPTSSATGQPGRYKFKESQLTPEFYKEHADEINQAGKLGQIEPDGPPQ